MPYEQYMGQAGPASDLFALAATFLHVLTGRPPRDFMGSSGSIEVPSALPGDERLGPILQRMLRHSPEERFQTAREVGQATLPSVGTAVVVHAPPNFRAARTAPQVVLPAAPRVVDETLKPLFHLLAPGALEMMSAGEDTEDRSPLFDWTALLFFSVITAGILPVTYLALARSGRRRALRFLQRGIPAVAHIEEIRVYKAPFDVPMGKVRFSFIADGERHRFSDVVMPERSDRWAVNDEVQILYDPTRNYAAIIIS